MVDERLEVRTQEVPPDPAVLVLLVDADMAAPDDVAAERLGVLGESGGLRVVDDDDVALPGMRGQIVTLGASVA